ncbi:MAG: hypothetical protein O3A95_00100 [Planctomycetota bacterium]|nr:hypothetical protein [Planctomycetota bacterium]
MYTRTLITCAVAACLGFSPAAFSQSEAPVQDPVGDALDTWQNQHGENWRLRLHDDLTTGRHLWGYHTEAPFTPSLDSDYEELARMAFDEAYGIFAVADGSLTLEQVKFLALQQIGTTDKVAVEFRQHVQGIEVLDASAHAIFNTKGSLLSLDSRAIPGVESLSVRPVADRFAAANAAIGYYADLEGGREPTFVGIPELVIIKHSPGKFMEPRLAWSLEIRNQENPTNPAGRNIYIAADNGSLEMLEERNLIHNQQATGTVNSFATPGTSANSGANPPTLHTMPFMNLTSPVGNTQTDANGDFVLNTPNSNPVNITATFNGPFCRVFNQAGGGHSTTTSFTPGAPGTLTMNAAQTEFITSEASCYDSVLDVRTWLKSIDPSDTTVDFQVRTNANLNSTCNAYFDGSSINMFSSGGGCNNTGFSTVVAHEEGHWMNVLYASGNGSDGFGEGNADVFAMYAYDTPIVGQNFFTGGGFIRTGTNNRQFCGDSNPGCYGQVHADGEVLMGALWKVRVNLNNTLGNASGDLTADTLLIGWMNAYNDGQIRTIIEEHWLTLDDNDGNIFNGTPNYADIDAGFRQQGFDGVDIQLIQIAHTPLGNSLSEAGPYVVDADITSLIGNVITSADVVYSVDGGPEVTIPMSNSGSSYTAGIPGQASPARVSYHIESSDSGGNTEDFPRNGSELMFVVGVENQIYFNDFEGATDEGWVHAQVTTQDDWMRGVPAGKVDDPSSAFDGNNCWGNDLGPSGFNGSYAANVNNYLESPSIDCTGETGVTLRFARWLNVEESRYDSAIITVNGIQVYINPFAGDDRASAWSMQEIDISAIADNNPSVKVRYTLISDGGLELGGWNLDNFELMTLEPVPGGSDTILLSGDTTALPGATVNYTMSAMSAGASWGFLASASNAGTVIFGHTFDVGPNFNVMNTGTADAAGNASTSFTIPPNLPSGATGYMEVGAQGAGGIEDSNLLTFTVQ